MHTEQWIKALLQSLKLYITGKTAKRNSMHYAFWRATFKKTEWNLHKSLSALSSLTLGTHFQQIK